MSYITLSEMGKMLDVSFPTFKKLFFTSDLHTYIGDWKNKKDNTPFLYTDFSDWVVQTDAGDYLITLHDASEIMFGLGYENVIQRSLKYLPLNKPFKIFRFGHSLYCKKGDFVSWFEEQTGDGRPLVNKYDITAFIAKQTENNPEVPPDLMQNIKRTVRRLDWGTNKLSKYEWYQRRGVNEILTGCGLCEIPERTSASEAPKPHAGRPCK